MPPPLSFICLVLLIIFLPGPCHSRTETLSGFLQTQFGPNLLIVFEGDREISGQSAKLQEIISKTTNQDDCLRSIADMCDYDVLRFGSAYLLKKRYTDPFELPCISSEEIIEYTKNVFPFINQLFPQRASDSDLMSPIRDLLQSLTDSDWKRIQHEPLPVTDLNDANKVILASLLTETFAGPLRYTCNMVSLHTKEVERSRLRLKNDDDGQPYLIWQSFSGRRPNDPWAILVDGVFGVPDIPTKEKYRAINISFEGTDIGGILDRMNRAANNAITYTASPEVLHIPVSVCGLTSENPVQAIHCLARLYDLRITSRGKTTYLSSKRPAYQSNQKIGEYLLNALPLPLRRTADKNYGLSSKRILLTLLPELQRRKDEPKELAYTGLHPLYKTALVLNVFSGFLKEICDDDMDRLAPYLNKIDTLYLRCMPSPAAPLRFTVLFERNGSLVQGPEYTVFGKAPRE